MPNSFKTELSCLDQINHRRFLKTVESDQGPEIIFESRKYINFSSNNYLGLANHSKLKEAAIEAIKKYGVGSGASRLITGSMSLHEELEQKIAAFKGTERALVFNSGYHANIGVISSLVGKDDVIFSDELNHASIVDGCRLSRARTEIYRHNNVGHLEKLLRLSTSIPQHLNTSTQRLIVTDTVFSMDSDLCNLPAILELAKKYDCLVLADEAHATGVFGKKGRGVVEHFGIPSNHPRLIQMGTLGKALGSFGAYVCGSADLIDYLVNKARSFIYTTALPPSVLAASLAAIDLVQDDSSLREKLWKNVEYFGNELRSPIPDPRSPIFPVIIGDSQKTMEISQKLFDHGIWAQGIRPPTVPEGTARIRLTVMATHTREHLDRCLRGLEKILNTPTDYVKKNKSSGKP